WGTSDSERALGFLKPFGSVTVLNGHIHQVLQKVEGIVTFHTAMSTAFPQPAPGTAPSPGPMKVPAEKLRSLLGLTRVQYQQGKSSLAVVDSNRSEIYSTMITLTSQNERRALLCAISFLNLSIFALAGEMKDVDSAAANKNTIEIKDF